MYLYLDYYTSLRILTPIRMGHLHTYLAVWLLLNIDVVGADCRNTTMKLFDDQIQALQKSMKTILQDASCDRKNVPVGFHAYMSSRKTFAKGAVWIYDKVITDTHNAYSAATGKFLVPERGLYILSYSTFSDPGKMSHASIYVNGNIKSWQACNNFSGKAHLTCSSSAILLLERYDIVYVADRLATASIRELATHFSGVQLR